jgi:hypothetical protein
MNPTAYFEEMLAKTRLDGRYRTFAQLERIAGAFPFHDAALAKRLVAALVTAGTRLGWHSALRIAA